MDLNFRKLKVYLDTSVVSYLEQDDAPEKMADTRAVWETLKKGIYDIYVSQVVLKELNDCNDSHKRELFFKHLQEINFNIWDEKNDLYNLAGVVHDALYGNKGFGLFTRDESDAIFRGLLRDAGCNRFHASTADFALGLAAKSHWGDDNLETAKYATCEEI